MGGRDPGNKEKPVMGHLVEQHPKQRLLQVLRSPSGNQIACWRKQKLWRCRGVSRYGVGHPEGADEAAAWGGWEVSRVSTDGKPGAFLRAWVDGMDLTLAGGTRQRKSRTWEQERSGRSGSHTGQGRTRKDSHLLILFKAAFTAGHAYLGGPMSSFAWIVLAQACVHSIMNSFTFCSQKCPCLDDPLPTRSLTR